ncbi:hypothetical protein NWE55_14845 [Myroides albus]|uniref:hypothetical protein n=1 Tax=Myroides albus TaxID=2562892 RepID=UPI0021592857|nr:hypothetical protein [Myroides albus]UVD79387.1 hypothetical protein NWE55_14845 [Myroides albus]
MKTTILPINDFLSNQLKEIITEFPSVLEMYYCSNTIEMTSYLLIHLNNRSDIDIIANRKGIKKLFKNYGIIVLLFDYDSLKYKFKHGYPLIELIYQEEHLIYQQEGIDFTKLATRSFKKFKNQYNIYKERYFQDYDLLSSELNKYKSLDAISSVFLVYERILELHLQYLEELYVGHISSINNLHQRIKKISKFNPEIEGLFIKRNEEEYYLIALIDRVKEAIEEDREVYYHEYFEAFNNVENTLHNFVQERFKSLKCLIKHPTVIPTITEVALELNKQDTFNDIIIERCLNQNQRIEEIYLYKTLILGSQTIYYLLVIGDKFANEQIKYLESSLQDKFNKQTNFVIIAHTKIWIQTELYSSQDFFADIIKNENKIYTSSKYNASLHWLVPHASLYTDLYYYNSVTNNTAKELLKNLQKLKKGQECKQSIPYLLSLYFMSFCRTYILAHLSYLPNYLSSFSLWLLCINVNTNLTKYQYLFDKFGSKFFSLLDYYRVLHQRLINFDTEKAEVLLELVTQLQSELKLIISIREV